MLDDPRYLDCSVVFVFFTKHNVFHDICLPMKKAYQLSNNFIIDSIVAGDIPSDSSVSINNTITTMKRSLMKLEPDSWEEICSIHQD